MMMRKLLVVVLLLAAGLVQAQVQEQGLRFSLASDLSLLRNFSPSQKFFALGQTIQFQFHVSGRETIFGNVRYYTPGRFKNNFTAPAVLPLTIPSSQTYRVSGVWNLHEIVIGWKHYFTGSFDAEQAIGIYGIGGFGLVFTNVSNTITSYIDTNSYRLQPTPRLGSGSWKRLTLDLGLGVEQPLGGNFSLYAEVQTWIHTSDYPSPYLHSNRRVPLPVTLNTGIRILFGD